MFVRSKDLRAAPVALGMLVCSAFVAVTASAQSTDDAVTLDPFRAAELGTDGFAVARPITLLPRTYGARLTADYGRGSLAFDAAGTANDYVVVRHQLVGTVGIAFAANDRVTVGVGLPVNLAMRGDPVPVPGAGLPEADGRVTSDPYVSARARLVGDPGDRFVLGAQLRLTLPLASAAMPTARYAGDRTATAQPALLAELTFDRLRLNGVLGGRFRGLERQRDLTVGQELTYAVGVDYSVVADRLALVAEAYGATDLRAFGRRSGSPLEVLAGARLRANDDWSVGAAVGTRLTQGYGASDLRVVLSVAYAPTQVASDAPPAQATVQSPETEADAEVENTAEVEDAAEAETAAEPDAAAEAEAEAEAEFDAADHGP